MIIRIYHKEAPKGLNLNNPRQTKCGLGSDNQTYPCVSCYGCEYLKNKDNTMNKRRDFKFVPFADNHLIE